jgi:hypothetical protein
MKRLILIGLLPLSLLAQTASQPARLWTNQQGRSVKASLVEVSGVNVVIQLENGTKSTVHIGTLSRADQDYLQKVQVSKPAASGAATPAPSGALVWPKEVISVDPKSIVVTEGLQDAKARQHHYTTGSFEYICTAPLAGTVMSEVAADFELVKTAFSRMPWGWEPKTKDGKLFQIYLTETDEDYIALGGDDRSASMTTTTGKSLVRFRTLGLKKVGARYQYDARQKEPGQVTNMVAHVMTDDHARILYPWSRLALEQFTRNLAYQNNGTMKFTDLESALKKEIKYRATEKAVLSLPRMLKYMRQTWLEPNQAVVQIQHEQRLDAQLLMYFFGYLDGDGSGGGWHQYCRETFKEPQVERNADNYARGLKLLDQLIGGRDDARLSADMTEKFKGVGIKLTP